MYSIYQFTFSLKGLHSDDIEVQLNNYSEWKEQLESIFGGNIKLKATDQYISEISLTREWYKFVKGRLTFSEPFIMFDKYKIDKIIPLYNRFQDCVYLQIIFDGVVIDKSSIDSRYDNKNMKFIDIEIFRKYMIDNLPGFNDSFTFDYKESDSHDQQKSEIIYNESIYLCNPSLIYSDHNLNEGNFINIKNHYNFDNSMVEFNFDIRPNNNNIMPSKFRRGVQLIYKTNGNNFYDVSTHYTSMFILFHRSLFYVNEYKKLDENMKFLLSISQKINDSWLKGRAYLMTLDNSKNGKTKFNSAYFRIMELNTLMDGELTAIQSDTQLIKEKYKIQYDRVLANVNNYCAELDEKHNELLELLLWPISTRDNLVNQIRGYKEPTDLQVKRLKDMYDSKNSSTMTNSMNALTIIVAIWGVLSFLYSSIFVNIGLSNVWLSVSILVLFILIMIVFFIYYLKLNPVYESKRLVYRHNADFLNHNISCESKIDKAIDIYKKVKLSSNSSESLIGPLCELLVNLIIIKIYTDGFEYDMCVKKIENV